MGWGGGSGGGWGSWGGTSGGGGGGSGSSSSWGSSSGNSSSSGSGSTSNGDTQQGLGGPPGVVDTNHAYTPPSNIQTGTTQAAADNVLNSSHGTNEYNGYCAEWVLNGLIEAGFDTISVVDAKNAGPELEGAGFDAIAANQESSSTRDDLPDGYNPEKGDIAVEIGNDGNGHDLQHIAIYDGNEWVSDTQQTHYDPYSSSKYPDATVTTTFYRDTSP